MATDPLVAVLPTGWERTTLGEACRRNGGGIQTGPFGSQLHASDYVSSGVPSIMPENIGDNRVIEEGIARITSVDASRLDRYLVRAGDIVCSRRGDVGRRALIRAGQTGWLCGTGCLRVRFETDDMDSAYASYYLGHPSVREWIVRHAQGATMPNLNTSILDALPFVVPPVEEQHAIAAILGSFDEKIDLNRRMNETLDMLAMAVLHRALEDARRSGAREDSLADHLELARGLSYRGAGLGSGLPLHNLNSIREGGGYKRDGIKYYSGEYRERHTVRPADVIVANTDLAHKNRIIGYPAIVPRGFGDVGLFSQDTYRVRPKPGSPLTQAFVYLLLRSEPLRSTVAGYANGTTVNHLPAEALARPTFPLPPVERIRTLDEQVSPLLAKIEANEDENETLAALRDALLPKLVSGELRVREAEAVVAAT